MTTPLVQVEGLSKSYSDSGEEARVLDDVNLELALGESVSLIGASGSGKSTLLAVLAGLMLPDSGTVRFDGRDITSMGEGGRADLRAERIGVVLQSDNLIPFLTAVENVELAYSLADREHPADSARQMLTELGVGDRLDDLPRRLSGGEGQRASLAVALANRPELLLADEVTAELDSVNADRILDVILSQSHDRDVTVLLVTHSMALAERTDRRLRITEGQVIEA